MKRFWDQATAETASPGFAVRLDGRPVRLPDGTPLHLESAALASAIAAEWQMAGGARGGEMDWADVPLTRLAGTTQSRITPDPEPVILELARWAESDLLCYHAAHPAELAARQEAEWQPWLDWAASRFGARLAVTSGVMHIPQPAEALAALAAAVAAMPPAGLAALGVMVPALGSLVLALAITQGCLAPERAWALASLDEDYQAGLWGRDPEADQRRAMLAAEVALAARFLALSIS
jgi:chaperone required for assembly of F1-ATPase